VKPLADNTRIGNALVVDTAISCISSKYLENFTSFSLARESRRARVAANLLLARIRNVEIRELGAVVPRENVIDHLEEIERDRVDQEVEVPREEEEIGNEIEDRILFPLLRSQIPNIDQLILISNVG